MKVPTMSKAQLRGIEDSGQEQTCRGVKARECEEPCGVRNPDFMSRAEMALNFKTEWKQDWINSILDEIT